MRSVLLLPVAHILTTLTVPILLDSFILIDHYVPSTLAQPTLPRLSCIANKAVKIWANATSYVVQDDLY